MKVRKGEREQVRKGEREQVRKVKRSSGGNILQGGP